MPSIRPFADIREPVSAERRTRIDQIKADTLAEIEEYERTIRDGLAWPLPPYRAVLVQTTDEIDSPTNVWEVSVPAVPDAVAEGLNIADAVLKAREAVCRVLDTGDWGFELIVETYPANPGDAPLDK